ncbi:MAG: hypothetical protein HKL96_03730 [Phycisphaerales bacterium]|nr:hypothetical protein [Phycisphaerales bacterium]
MAYPQNTYDQMVAMRSALVRVAIVIPFMAAFAAIAGLLPSFGKPQTGPQHAAAAVFLKAILFTPTGINPLGLPVIFVLALWLAVLVRFIFLWRKVRRLLR